MVTWTSFTGTTSRGFTQAQLASTASYQAKNLQGVDLVQNDLTGWDLSGQDLRNSAFGYCLFSVGCVEADGTSTKLSGADLRNASFGVWWSEDLPPIFDSTTIYNQWTTFDFDPIAAGLTLVMSPAGDLNANDALDAADVDQLTKKLVGSAMDWWGPHEAFNLDGDDIVDLEDHRGVGQGLERTWFGDANLDGEFDSSDFAQGFAGGRYEQGWVNGWGGVCNGASWAEGDWNGDGIFSSADFITAFVDGGYEQGPRPDVAAVPEPAAWTLLVIGLPLWLIGRRAFAI